MRPAAPVLKSVRYEACLGLSWELLSWNIPWNTNDPVWRGVVMRLRQEEDLCMTCLHVDTEEKMESTKEEVEVWIRMWFSSRCGCSTVILQ